MTPRLLTVMSTAALLGLAGCSGEDPFAWPDRSGCTFERVEDHDLDGQTDWELVVVNGADEVELRRDETDHTSGERTLTERTVDERGCTVRWVETTWDGGEDWTAQTVVDSKCDAIGNQVSGRQVQVRRAGGVETGRYEWDRVFTLTYDAADRVTEERLVWTEVDSGEVAMELRFTYAYDEAGRVVGLSKHQDGELEYDQVAEWHDDHQQAWFTYLFPNGKEAAFEATFDEWDRATTKVWTGEWISPRTEETTWSESRRAVEGITVDLDSDGQVDQVTTVECDEGVPVTACRMMFDGSTNPNAAATVDGETDWVASWSYTCP